MRNPNDAVVVRRNRGSFLAPTSVTPEALTALTLHLSGPVETSILGGRLLQDLLEKSFRTTALVASVSTNESLVAATRRLQYASLPPLGNFLCLNGNP